jgi:hypothetical protein
VCLLCQGRAGAAKFYQLRCGGADQRDEDFARPSALATEAPQDFLPCLLQLLGLALQCGRSGGALLHGVMDELADFFCALYKVGASVTRWRPCSAGLCGIPPPFGRLKST